MAPLILQMQTSVDGRVDAADPQIPWTMWDWQPPSPWDAALLAAFNETLAEIDLVLLSRPMAEGGYIDHWTNVAEQHPTDPDYAFAAAVVRAQKLIITEREVRGDWPRTDVRGGSFAATVRRAKSEASKAAIAFGGTSFATALLSEGLVDELQLYANPTAVGDGESIFDGPTHLELLGAQAYDCGIVVSRYAPRHRSGTNAL